MEKKYKGKEVNNQEMTNLRNEYKEWKEKRKKQTSPFFVVYTDFKEEHLKEISGGALKLYLYLGLHINTFTGECWHSIETIADYFGNDQRTVKKWFKELEDRKLIRRIQRGFMWVANTFLLPYGNEEVDNDRK
jgi:DNA-binding MarR family transcriptional regulator